jgi:pyruvate formate lyase activating enzyme
MQIAGYLKTSLIEWPGKVCSVIFTFGCNFRCPFCHNPELVSLSEKKPKLEKEEEILSDLEKRKKWIEGVVVTGGEPTMQKDLPEFLEKLKKLGYSTTIHTNGTNPEVLKKLIKESLVDYFCMDVKGNFENYDKYTGVNFDFGLVKESLKIISQSAFPFELRSTLVPGLHTIEDLTQLAKEAREIFDNCKLKTENCSWYLQQFRPISCFNPEFTKVKPFSKEEMENFQKIFSKNFPKVFLRGVY